MTLKTLLLVPDAIVAMDISEGLAEVFGPVVVAQASLKDAMTDATRTPECDLAFVQVDNSDAKALHLAVSLVRSGAVVVVLNGVSHQAGPEPYLILDRPFTRDALVTLLIGLREKCGANRA